MTQLIQKIGKRLGRVALGVTVLKPLLITVTERLEATNNRLVAKLGRTTTPLPRVSRLGRTRRAVDPLLDTVLLTYLEALDFAAELADRLLGGEDELAELVTDIPINLIRDLTSLQRRLVLSSKRVREAEARVRRRTR